MKALVILTDIQEHQTYDHLVSYSYTMENVDEAIAELETLLKPKTCDGCKYYGMNCNNEYDHIYCTKLNMFTKDKFGCISYESKEMQ
jgi:hypothetical protein